MSKLVLGHEQVRSMMENAQRLIEQRKKSLEMGASASSAAATAASAGAAPAPGFNINSNKGASAGGGGDILHSSAVVGNSKRIADLKAEIAAKLSSLPTRVGVDAVTSSSDGPRPLILDEHGHTVDASGNQVPITPHMPTLKANIHAKRRAEFTQQLQQKRPALDSTSSAAGGGVASDSGFFDPRVGGAGGVRRARRGFSFHEPGKFQQQASRLRARAQLDRLQAEIACIARRTGISSAMRLAMAAPRPSPAGSSSSATTGAVAGGSDGVDETGVPAVEWWDRVVLGDPAEGYDPPAPATEAAERFSSITNLVEHPVQLSAPLKKPEVSLPLMFTKNERKKMRRTNRREAWKDKQEKIRLGLEPAPEPKVRLSNLMRVLGNEAVQDPTKVEAHVRAQMARRQKQHQSANAARRLSEHERKQKRLAKLREDTSDQVHVAIYRVKDLSNPAKKFKVETNACQLFMTGTVVLFGHVNVVVVEGGPKQQKKYKQLMLHRIKWDEDLVKQTAEGAVEEENSCCLVWEGTVRQRSFGELRFKSCPTDSFARQHFRQHSVEHYWDLVYSSAVLEQESIE